MWKGLSVDFSCKEEVETYESGSTLVAVPPKNLIIKIPTGNL
jgi:hypothetical protein